MVYLTTGCWGQGQASDEFAEGWGALFGGMAELAAGLGPALAPKPPAAWKSLLAEDRLEVLLEHLFSSCPPDTVNRQAAAALLGAAPVLLSTAFLDRWVARWGPVSEPFSTRKVDLHHSCISLPYD
jgi:hypothetical protein